MQSQLIVFNFKVNYVSRYYKIEIWGRTDGQTDGRTKMAIEGAGTSGSSRILIRILVENAAVADRGISGNSSGILIRIPADY